jgi:hypothetical protein
VGELAVTSDGALLVASPRLGVVLRFAGEEGAPPTGFCERCDAQELRTPARDVWTLEHQPVAWPNGARVTLFGDAAVIGRYAAFRDASQALLRIERGARYGTFGVATLLLFALFITRQAGTDSVPSVVRTIVHPNLRSYALAALIIALGFASGLGAGWWFSGLGSGLAVGAVIGFFFSRLIVAPMLARRLGASTAAVAWSTHGFPLEEGEHLRWVAFAWPRRGLGALAAQAKEASGADDWLDLLESLAPRLSLIAVTDRRIVALKTSMLGAPLDAPLVLHAQTPETPPSRLVAQTTRFTRAWSFPGVTSAPREVFAEQAGWLCRECRKPWGSCAHVESGVAGPLALSLVFPGAGHLATGDLGKARVLAITSTGLLLQAAGAWLPQYIGTLPQRPQLWLEPLWFYLLTGIVSAATIALAWWKSRVRAELSR